LKPQACFHVALVIPRNAFFFNFLFWQQVWKKKLKKDKNYKKRKKNNKKQKKTKN